MVETLSRHTGRKRKVSEMKFVREYNRFRSGKYGDITEEQFAEMQGIPIGTFNGYKRKLKSGSLTISKQERKDLKTLADDFRLLERQDVRDIIENCKSYAEGQQKIMRVYTSVYM